MFYVLVLYVCLHVCLFVDGLVSEACLFVLLHSFQLFFLTSTHCISDVEVQTEVRRLQEESGDNVHECLQLSCQWLFFK